MKTHEVKQMLTRCPQLIMAGTIFVALVFFALVNLQPVNVSASSPPTWQQIEQRIRVVYQLTDVAVRDHDGNHVPGLSIDDFVLFIDGKETQVKSVDEFTAVLEDTEEVRHFVQLFEESRELGLEPPPAPTPPRYIVIIFDRYNMGEKGMMEAKETARQLVTQSLLPHDRVAVFQFNKTLRTLTAPTIDRDRILSAIDAAGGVNLNDNYKPKRIEFFPPKQRSDAGELKMLLIEKAADFKNYLDTIRILAQTMGNLPGRKTFFVFSEGPNVHNPVRMEDIAERSANIAGSGYADFARDLLSYLTPQSVVQELNELSRYLASNNTSLYTIRRGNIKSEWLTGVDIDIANALANSGELAFDDSLSPGKAISTELDNMEMARVGVLQDFAAMSKGKFFDAGMVLPKLVETVRKEVGDYYVIGFSPPEDDRGSFHNIQIRTKNPDYRVVHRDGYFGRKKFEKLSSKERAVHLEEGFLMPGLVNELELNARGIPIPLSVDPTAIITFSVNGKSFGRTSRGNHELEMVINLEDRQGQIRYRTHKTFNTRASGSLPDRLSFNINVPLLWDPCAVYLAARDNATGARSTWREVFRPAEQGSAQVRVTEPMLISENLEGDLNKWKGEDIRDGVNPVDPVRPSSFSIQGTLLADNSVSQGGEASFVMLIGNMPAETDPGNIQLTAQYLLDPRTEEAYQLQPISEEIRYLADRKMLQISVRLPLGLAQKPSGELVAVLHGVIDSKYLMASTSYRVAPFSLARALELRDDPRIEEFK